jgi:hypothetical protein
MAEEATTVTQDEMSNETTPQSEMDNTPETGEMPATEPTNEKPQSSTEDQSKELADLRAALKKANAEAAKHRKDAKELAAFKDQIESEKLSQQEKLEKKLADLQKNHDDYLLRTQERIVNTEIRAQAASLGFADLNDAIRLIDRSELEYDDDGAPINAKEVLESMLKTKPYLAKPMSKPAPSVSATNPSRSQSNTNALSWEIISKMTPDEYNRQRAEINKWMAKNPIR